MCTGSHTVLSLLDHGCKVTIIDNLDNAFQIAYTRMQKLAGDKSKNMTFVKVRRMLRGMLGSYSSTNGQHFFTGRFEAF